MSRLMLISCGIQWLAQALMYFSQAHLYLNGTSWLTSALELMIRLSSTRMRRCAAAGASRDGACAVAEDGAGGTKPLTGGKPSPVIGFATPSSSKFSITGKPRN